MNAAAAIFALAALVAPLESPEAESRAQKLEQEIRCVVCENEPISQSTAEIAVDMRRLVRERIAAGDDDAEIRAFFSDRYGDFVLLRPPVDPRTWLLWGAPLLLLAIGVVVVARLATAGRGTPLEPDQSPDDR